MSEAEQIFHDFHEAVSTHRAKSGNPARVVIAGEISYDALVGAISVIYPNHNYVNVSKSCRLSFELEFYGVEVFKSYSFQRGFIAGGLGEPES